MRDIYFNADLNVVLTTSFNPSDQRNAIMKEILEHSDSMIDECLYCTNVANDELWVQCERCARWVHGRCTGKNEDNWAENEFKCELCINYKES